MPLSRPADRSLLHRRDITLQGYLRADGMVDVEAHMRDTKTYSFANISRGPINAGDPLHDMGLRATVDRDLKIVACEASMDATPYTICPGAAPNFSRLAGLVIGKGFIKAAMARVGGTEGCTHLRELLQQLATVAYQTMYSVSAHEGGKAPRKDGSQQKMSPALLNSCHAYDEEGALVAAFRAAEPALAAGN